MFSHALNKKGVTFKNIVQDQRAIEDYNKVISLQPNDAETYNQRGCRDLQKVCAMGVCKALELTKSRGYCNRFMFALIGEHESK